MLSYGPLFHQGVYSIIDGRNNIPFKILNLNYLKRMKQYATEYYIIVTDLTSNYHGTVFVLGDIKGFNGHNLSADYKIERLCVDKIKNNKEIDFDELDSFLNKIIIDIGITYLNNQEYEYTIKTGLYSGTKVKIFNNTSSVKMNFKIIDLMIDGYSIASSSASDDTLDAIYNIVKLINDELGYDGQLTKYEL